MKRQRKSAVANPSFLSRTPNASIASEIVQVSNDLSRSSCAMVNARCKLAPPEMWIYAPVDARESGRDKKGNLAEGKRRRSELEGYKVRDRILRRIVSRSWEALCPDSLVRRKARIVIEGTNPVRFRGPALSHPAHFRRMPAGGVAAEVRRAPRRGERHDADYHHRSSGNKETPIKRAEAPHSLVEPLQGFSEHTLCPILPLPCGCGKMLFQVILRENKPGVPDRSA